MSQLSIVGIVTKPPREDPRDSVLPKSEGLGIVPTPAPLVGPEDATADAELAPGQESAVTPDPGTAPEGETAAVPVDEAAP
jgi:hypothetical protein